MFKTFQERLVFQQFFPYFPPRTSQKSDSLETRFSNFINLTFGVVILVASVFDPILNAAQGKIVEKLNVLEMSWTLYEST